MREFREIRLDLGADGTGDAAAPYISAARAQLGVLKNQMQLGGLAQGSLTRRLPDGTAITVTSMFGRDTVRILAAVAATAVAINTVPVSEVAAQEPPAPPVASGAGFIVAGFLEDDATSTTHAAVWHGTSPQLLPVPVDTANGLGSLAAAVSADGSTVAGSYPAGSYKAAFLWHGGATYETIYQLPSTDVFVAGVNQDGSHVVGWTTPTAHLWLWTRTGGVKLLPDLGFGPGYPPNGNQDLAISPNGQYIVGHLSTSGSPFSDYVVAVWDATGKLKTTLPSPAGWFAYAVNDQGLIAGATTTIHPQTILYDSVHGGYRTIGPGYPTDLGDKALVGGGLDGSNASSGAGAWYLGPGNAQIALDTTSEAAAVSKDGAIIAGTQNLTTPTFWTGGRQRFFTALPGFSIGGVSKVANPPPQ